MRDAKGRFIKGHSFIGMRSWTEESKDKLRGENSPFWKGDEVGYHGLHKWIYKVKGKPLQCTFCPSTENIHWANKSYLYKRDPDDWISLCVPCHRKYDFQMREQGMISATARGLLTTVPKTV